jgi:hypothetical protein
VIKRPFDPPGGANAAYADMKKQALELGEKIVETMKAPETVADLSALKATLDEMAKLQSDYTQAKSAGATDKLAPIAQNFSSNLTKAADQLTATVGRIRPLLVPYQRAINAVIQQYPKQFLKDGNEFAASIKAYDASVQPLADAAQVIGPIIGKTREAARERAKNGEQITPTILEEEQLKAVTQSLESGGEQTKTPD